MAGTGVPHIAPHVLGSTHTSGGYFRLKKSVLSKIATFDWLGVEIGGSVGTVGQNDFFMK